MQKSVKIEKLTPKRAAELLKLNTLDGQRNLRPTHVETLKRKIVDGRFHVGEIATCVCADGEKLINGQHQCTAVVESGLPITAVVQRFVLNGESKEEIATLFSQFDQHKSRTAGDVAWIFAVELGWGDWPRRLVHVIASALGSLTTGKFKTRESLRSAELGGTRPSNDQVAAEMGRNRKACEFVHSILGFGDTKKMRHMYRASVVAAMLQTYRKDREDAALFWAAIRDGEMLRAKSPELRLREYLLNTSTKNATGGEKGVAHPVAMYRFCIVAWNAMRTNSPMPSKFFKDAEIPVVK